MASTNKMLVMTAVIITLAVINTAWSVWILSRGAEAGLRTGAIVMRTLPVW